VTLARRAGRDPLARALLAWATPYRSWAELRRAVTDARERRRELRRDDAQLVLATAHGTKGLEFDHVACIGLDDGVFPSRRTLEEADDPRRALEEERRLAYVAWTRARTSLVLLYDPAAPSPFLREAFSDAELGLQAAAHERSRAA
jgi:superfamily I DNA/RNA helicase